MRSLSSSTLFDSRVKLISISGLLCVVVALVDFRSGSGVVFRTLVVSSTGAIVVEGSNTSSNNMGSVLGDSVVILDVDEVGTVESTVSSSGISSVMVPLKLLDRHGPAFLKTRISLRYGGRLNGWS